MRSMIKLLKYFVGEEWVKVLDDEEVKTLLL